MTALVWMLAWLPHVLSAMNELPKPFITTLNSSHFIHMLKWEPGPETPPGAYYHVTVTTATGISWVPVVGCEHVQHPLVCNLTEAFSDPTLVYFTKIQELLEGQDSQTVILPGFTPIKDTHLDLPLLTVTPRGRDLCVDLQPPTEHLRKIYDSLKYKLRIKSNNADKPQWFEDTKSLRRQFLKNMASGTQYCVSVSFSQGLFSRKSNYSQPVCASTPGHYTADPLISAMLCLLVMSAVVVAALLVYTGFTCLRKHLPLVLTSIHHLEEVRVIPSCNTSMTSLLNVESTPPSSVACVSLPAPSNVSISSFNMEHTLSFLPGLNTPSGTCFTVQTLQLRKKTWRPVAACLKLTAGQTCNLTRAFKDPLSLYRARVQASTPTRTSNWTVSRQFQPVSDTVLGPPDVSVSGCGNCLLLQLRVPATNRLQQLKQMYRQVVLDVRRSRDGAQFSLSLPYKEKNNISYLQTGVEYCVTVSVKSFYNSNSVPSKPGCAFTSAPRARSSLYLVFSLLGAFCALGFLIIGLVVCASKLSITLPRQPVQRALVTHPNSYILLQCRNHGSADKDPL